MYRNLWDYAGTTFELPGDLASDVSRKIWLGK
jgi:hypothetical protein